MTEHIVSSIEEWSAWADEQAEPRARLIGDLADQIRVRFGANKHVPVWLSEAFESFSRGCDCCGDEIDVYLVIECGDDTARVRSGWDDLRQNLADWLDEPRRRAEQAAAKAAKEQAQREQSAVFDRTVLRPITDAMQELEAEGVANQGEWHDKLMDRLGVGGFRYGTGAGSKEDQ